MPFPSEIIREHRIDGTYSLVLKKEDLESLYPRMFRYKLALLENYRIVAQFRTNTYEYTPVIPIKAESVAYEHFEYWTERITAGHEKFVEYLKRQERLRKHVYKNVPSPGNDAVIIQGSSRPDGNCAVMASWIMEKLLLMGMKPAVFYPSDMYILPCTGCYQCFNYGRCVFIDDMAGLYGAVKGASFVAVCSPVYTNTVPAPLKAVFDRFQAYHAMTSLGNIRHSVSGLFLSTAGRKGLDNFSHIVPVADAFMEISGIKKKGQVLVDNLDQVYDVRSIPGLRERVEKKVDECLK
ncbi:flavodoxin family protein [Methanolacinia paynteri]|uniref:flavodoxin family protein n=1 Tax=Methanolacinia paynteri TaxID=230356 RepID=UPI0014700084|nr:flavodoxin family protein [Methanolacinia paynteri]